LVYIIWLFGWSRFVNSLFKFSIAFWKLMRLSAVIWTRILSAIVACKADALPVGQLYTLKNTCSVCLWTYTQAQWHGFILFLNSLLKCDCSPIWNDERFIMDKTTYSSWYDNSQMSKDYRYTILYSIILCIVCFPSRVSVSNLLVICNLAESLTKKLIKRNIQICYTLYSTPVKLQSWKIFWSKKTKAILHWWQRFQYHCIH